jgi:hypothetical protein
METLLLTLALLALAVIAGTKLGTALVARSVKPGAMERRREEGMREHKRANHGKHRDARD